MSSTKRQRSFLPNRSVSKVSTAFHQSNDRFTYEHYVGKIDLAEGRATLGVKTGVTLRRYHLICQCYASRNAVHPICPEHCFLNKIPLCATAAQKAECWYCRPLSAEARSTLLSLNQKHYTADHLSVDRMKKRLSQHNKEVWLIEAGTADLFVNIIGVELPAIDITLFLYESDDEEEDKELAMPRGSEWRYFVKDHKGNYHEEYAASKFHWVTSATSRTDYKHRSKLSANVTRIFKAYATAGGYLFVGDGYERACLHLIIQLYHLRHEADEQSLRGNHLLHKAVAALPVYDESQLHPTEMVRRPPPTTEEMEERLQTKVERRTPKAQRQLPAAASSTPQTSQSKAASQSSPRATAKPRGKSTSKASAGQRPTSTGDADRGKAPTSTQHQLRHKGSEERHVISSDGDESDDGDDQHRPPTKRPRLSKTRKSPAKSPVKSPAKPSTFHRQPPSGFNRLMRQRTPAPPRIPSGRSSSSSLEQGSKADTATQRRRPNIKFTSRAPTGTSSTASRSTTRARQSVAEPAVRSLAATGRKPPAGSRRRQQTCRDDSQFIDQIFPAPDARERQRQEERERREAEHARQIRLRILRSEYAPPSRSGSPRNRRRQESQTSGPPRTGRRSPTTRSSSPAVIYSRRTRKSRSPPGRPRSGRRMNPETRRAVGDPSYRSTPAPGSRAESEDDQRTVRRPLLRVEEILEEEAAERRRPISPVRPTFRRTVDIARGGDCEYLIIDEAKMDVDADRDQDKPGAATDGQRSQSITLSSGILTPTDPTARAEQADFSDSDADEEIAAAALAHEKGIDRKLKAQATAIDAGLDTTKESVASRAATPTPTSTAVSGSQAAATTVQAPTLSPAATDNVTTTDSTHQQTSVSQITVTTCDQSSAQSCSAQTVTTASRQSSIMSSRQFQTTGVSASTTVTPTATTSDRGETPTTVSVTLTAADKAMFDEWAGVAVSTASTTATPQTTAPATKLLSTTTDINFGQLGFDISARSSVPSASADKVENSNLTTPGKIDTLTDSFVHDTETLLVGLDVALQLQKPTTTPATSATQVSTSHLAGLHTITTSAPSVTEQQALEALQALAESTLTGATGTAVTTAITTTACVEALTSTVPTAAAATAPTTSTPASTADTLTARKPALASLHMCPPPAVVTHATQTDESKIQAPSTTETASQVSPPPTSTEEVASQVSLPATTTTAREPSTATSQIQCNRSLDTSGMVGEETLLSLETVAQETGPATRYFTTSPSTLLRTGNTAPLYDEAVAASARYPPLEPITATGTIYTRDGNIITAEQYQAEQRQLPLYEAVPGVVQALIVSQEGEFRRQLEATVAEPPFPFPTLPPAEENLTDASHYDVPNLPLSLVAHQHGIYNDPHLLTEVGPSTPVRLTDAEVAAVQENIGLGLLAASRAHQLVQNARVPVANPTTILATLTSLVDSFRPLTQAYLQVLRARRRAEFRSHIPRQEYIDRMCAPALTSTVLNEPYVPSATSPTSPVLTEAAGGYPDNIDPNDPNIVAVTALATGSAAADQLPTNNVTTATGTIAVQTSQAVVSATTTAAASVSTPTSST